MTLIVTNINNNNLTLAEAFYLQNCKCFIVKRILLCLACPRKAHDIGLSR